MSEKNPLSLVRKVVAVAKILSISQPFVTSASWRIIHRQFIKQIRRWSDRAHEEGPSDDYRNNARRPRAECQTMLAPRPCQGRVDAFGDRLEKRSPPTQRRRNFEGPSPVGSPGRYRQRMIRRSISGSRPLREWANSRRNLLLPPRKLALSIDSTALLPVKSFIQDQARAQISLRVVTSARKLFGCQYAEADCVFQVRIC